MLGFAIFSFTTDQTALWTLTDEQWNFGLSAAQRLDSLGLVLQYLLMCFELLAISLLLFLF